MYKLIKNVSILSDEASSISNVSIVYQYNYIYTDLFAVLVLYSWLTCI